MRICMVVWCMVVCERVWKKRKDGKERRDRKKRKKVFIDENGAFFCTQ